MQTESLLQCDATVSPPAKRVLVTTAVPEQKTAWTKARKDVLQLAGEAGYEPLALPQGASPRAWWRFLRELSSRVGPGGHVLIEYPIDQRKRLLPLWQFCRWRGVRLDALIHDLDSLRFDTPRHREITILRMFDGLISHNAAMTSWLREGGIRGQVVDLGLFDYCTAHAQRAWHEEGISAPLKVVCAGNLSYPKARYLYDPRLGQLEGVELSLFGVFFEPDRMPDSPVQYKNAFDPDTPQLDGPYHFGLVWDGSGVESCEGSYGHYMRYNNPHKLSLYAALGLPVVVWEEAAIARFVLDRGIGVVISDLRELGRLPSRVSSEAYRRMATNMRAVGQAALEGQFLRRALGELQAA